ncbi:zinc finger CCCH domain-containing protein 17-like [Aristolochia californica]|uniref:zinc finger CCCH domain-containing protein 17-like n=1 Tax=Aristolochia californica TaxID=171875 RepID=UPI0035D9EC77
MDLDNGDRDGNRRLYQRLGPASGAADRQQKVCYHWLAGRCNRFPCQFLHSEQASTGINGASKRAQHFPYDGKFQGSVRRSPNSVGQAVPSKWGRGRGGGSTGLTQVFRKTEKVCTYWVGGHCSYGERCRYQHSWFVGDSFTFLTSLEGHQKAISGIALPSGSDKLYSGSKDESVRVWDCQSGKCAGTFTLGGEIGCMISEGPCVFIGIPNSVKAWNTLTNTELNLTGPVGQVYSMIFGNETLFAGVQDGSILAWKFIAAGNCFEPAASLNGHNLAVVSLIVGANRLYSGSMDKTIKVWDLATLQCLQTLTDHTSVVMSVLCWDQFLLSASLDKTIKVWAATESGNLEVIYTHSEEHGVLSLCGMHDAQAKPVLLCACNDNTVCLYDLPSFSERGKLFSKEEVRAIQVGPGGLFFTGDGAGHVKVWKWMEQANNIGLE